MNPTEAVQKLERAAKETANVYPCTECGRNILNPQNSNFIWVFGKANAFLAYEAGKAAVSPFYLKTAVENLRSSYRGEELPSVKEAEQIVETCDVEIDPNGEPICPQCHEREK